MIKTRRGQTASALARAVSLFFAGVAALWVIYLAQGALLIIYISVLLAVGVAPIVRSLEQQLAQHSRKHHPPRWLAILIIYLALVGTVTMIGLLVVPPLVQQAQDLWLRLPSILETAQTFLIEHRLLGHRLTLDEAVGRSATSTFGTVASAVTSVIGGVLAVVTILVLTFYLLLDSEAIFAAFAHLFPRTERHRVEHSARKISAKVSAWLNGQVILAGAIGASSAIGLYLLHVPYFYVLAVLAAAGEMIPIVGPILSAIPAALAGFSVSPHAGLFVILFWLAQQQAESHYLVPRVMSRQVGVSAVTVIVALLIGGALLGILGALLAIPTAAIVQVLVQELLDERDRRESRLAAVPPQERRRSW